jgi:hypothetical protein
LVGWRTADFPDRKSEMTGTTTREDLLMVERWKDRLVRHVILVSEVGSSG